MRGPTQKKGCVKRRPLAERPRSSSSVVMTAKSTSPRATERGASSECMVVISKRRRRLVREKLANDRQKQPLAQVVAGGDAQRGDRIAGEPGEKAEERLGFVEEAVDGDEGRFSGRAQADAAPFALEKLDAEVLFDAPQLLAHGGGRLVQLPRGRAHRAGARHHEHVLQRGDAGSDQS